MADRPGSVSVELDTVRETDVLVVGGGPSGTVAALSARRNGADVTLLERESYFGGTMTGVMVNTLNAYRSTDEEKQLVVEGIALEVFREILDLEGTHATEERTPVETDHAQYTDPVVSMHALDRLIDRANVHALFNTFGFDAIVEDGAVEGVAYANKDGGGVIYADAIVDCSGDADVAAAAGAPFQHGREEDGRYHGGALLMQVTNIDLDRLIEYMKEPVDMTPEELDALEAEKQRLLGGGGEPNTSITPEGEIGPGFGPHTPRDWDQIEADRRAGRPLHFSVRGGPSGIGATYEYEGDVVPPEAKFDREWLDWVKAGEVPSWYGTPKDLNVFPPPPSLGMLGFGMFKRGKHRYDTMLSGMYEAWFDQTDQDDISEAVRYMRRVNWCYMEFLRERIPGFEDAYITKESSTVGTRESRRIVGGYVLDAADETAGRDFPDVVAKSGRPPNAHSVTGEWGTMVYGSVKGPYDIPYRCLLPRKVEDLLVAGRTISVSHVALGGVRDQGTCMATGEAAGAAAALCSRLGVTPRDLDVKLLQQHLLEQGAFLFEEGREDEVEAVADVPTLEERLTAAAD